MAKLVFDIETSALSLDSFDESQLEYLFREAERLPDEVSRQNRRAELAQQLNLYPLTARVVCVGMLNVDTCRGQVLFLAEEHEEGDKQTAVELVACMDEAELLTSFWNVARRYDSIVTFNGRSFDVPFLYLRSALLNVPIPRKDWLGYRYQIEPHCDLAEQFTFYNVSGRDGAARRFNLDFYCRAFGIESPKSHGVTGRDVNTLMAAGAYREIAAYCLRDVKATLELYQIWRDRLSGIK